MSDGTPVVLLFDKEADAAWSALTTAVDTGKITLEQVGTQRSGRVTLRFCGVCYDISVAKVPLHLSEYRNIFCNLDTERVRSAIAIDLSSEVQGGSKVASIVARLLQLAADLGEAAGAIAVLWVPANLISGMDYFAEAARRYAKGGPFPALTTVNFEVTSVSIKSSGLDYFADQEVEFRCGDLPPNEAMHRVVRIVHDMAVNGPVLKSVDVTGLDAGEMLSLVPSEDGRRVQIWHKSSTLDP